MSAVRKRRLAYEGDKRDASYRWDEDRLVALALEVPGLAPALPRNYSRSAVVLALARGVIETQGKAWFSLEPVQKEAAIAWGKLALAAFECAGENLRLPLAARQVDE